ncbi:MAG: DUF3307 domain-containing protein [Luteibacter sp.]|uniref:DUF3307 domain-containing protein n=1 Tax=Luteibacter sp. TaxID=1886636 RepID=UPI0028088F97|nr:DUF3307 domain-containing protein [Luteibacter sp.]MDQ7996074.1 DUF3307 domain-containing protein [Luteibacter sp.]
MIFVTTIFLLLVGHALADYPLQGDFLSRAKNERAPIPGVPWWQAMAAHCLIHAGVVYLVTGSIVLAALEFVIHGITDRAKCFGWIGFSTDQAIHVACKFLWAITVVYYSQVLV